MQGVFYRASARDKAVGLGLTGWTRNLADGRVEVLAEGGEPEIAAFIEWCGRGPLWARVVEIKVVDETPQGDLTGFAVLKDG